MSVLADTSVWVDHFRRGDAALAGALQDGRVLTHPMVVGELICGNLPDRRRTVESLLVLPSVPAATDDEARALIERTRLHGRGLSWIDVHLIAAALIVGVPLWTRDAPLSRAAHAAGAALWTP